MYVQGKFTFEELRTFLVTFLWIRYTSVPREDLLVEQVQLLHCHLKIGPIAQF